MNTRDTGGIGCLFQFPEMRKLSDVYMSTRDNVSTSSNCGGLLAVECSWKIHIGEVWYIWISRHSEYESLSRVM